MNAVAHFLEMGGYADYVWSAYGVCFALIALEVVQLVIRARRAGTTAPARHATVRARYRGTLHEPIR
ncbi:MAG: hypothetical protein NAOJABEB_02457 [Steroidobacteraceae bacterium]|nr:hypothetical protein [Steroidobacteraceae bacterium]